MAERGTAWPALYWPWAALAAAALVLVLLVVQLVQRARLHRREWTFTSPISVYRYDSTVIHELYEQERGRSIDADVEARPNRITASVNLGGPGGDVSTDGGETKKYHHEAKSGEQLRAVLGDLALSRRLSRVYLDRAQVLRGRTVSRPSRYRSVALSELPGRLLVTGTFHRDPESGDLTARYRANHGPLVRIHCPDTEVRPFPSGDFRAACLVEDVHWDDPASVLRCHASPCSPPEAWFQPEARLGSVG